MLISYLRYWGEMLTSLSSQVIQEVAAARSILIQCGGVQVDGYEFSDFLELQTTFWKARQILAHSLSQTRPIVKLIRSVSHLRRYPLGTLIDMYHAYQASDPRDRIFALLGMASESYAADLEVDYSVTWTELRKRLIRFLLGPLVTAETWQDRGRDAAVIRCTCRVLGTVVSVPGDPAPGQRKFAPIKKYLADELEPMTDDSWDLSASATSVQVGDIICLLEGASQPTIIRPGDDYFSVVMVAAPLRYSHRQEEGDTTGRDEMVHTVVLVWDWGERDAAAQGGPLPALSYPLAPSQPISRNKVAGLRRTGEKIASSTRRQKMIAGPTKTVIPAMTRSAHACIVDGQAVRLWNMALLLEDATQFSAARVKFRELVRLYQEPASGQVHGFPQQDYLWVGRAIQIGARLQAINSSKGIPVTPPVGTVFTTAANQEAIEPIRRFFSWVLGSGNRNVEITKDMMTAAAGNEKHGEAVLKFFLDQLGPSSAEIEISRETMLAAARNQQSGEAIMRLLLLTCGEGGAKASVRLQDDRVLRLAATAAAENERCGDGIMSLLLNALEQTETVTEQTMMAAASNQRCGEAIMKLLLDSGKARIHLTDRVILAAVGNEKCGDGIMELLLNATVPSREATIARGLAAARHGNMLPEEAFCVAAANEQCGYTIMRILLDQVGGEAASSSITEAVVIAAAGNEKRGEAVMRLLIKKSTTTGGIKLTDKVLRAAQGNQKGGLKVLSLLADQNASEQLSIDRLIKSALLLSPASVPNLVRHRRTILEMRTVLSSVRPDLTLDSLGRILGTSHCKSPREQKVEAGSGLAAAFDEDSMACMWGF